MALALTDLKKTTRTTELGRQLYPYQIRDDRYLAALSYAIGYYEQMVGRRRSEFESSVLLEFFGDPKLARGLVACLGRTYRWHQQSFAEVLSAEQWQTLQARQLDSPAALRALLYTYVNQHHAGFLLPDQHETVFQQLCADLPLSPQQFAELMGLDAEDAALLVRSGTAPEAVDVVAAYNFHALETVLRNAKSITLTLSGAVWPMMLSVRNLARRYHLTFDVVEGPRDLFGQQLIITWHGRKDALHSWSRYGRKVVRAVLRLLAAHPDAPLSGLAQVALQGSTYVVNLGPRELATLGVEARSHGKGAEVWETMLDSSLAQAWSRAASKQLTADWRIRRDPEPIITERGVLVPDFVALRNTQRVALFVPATATSLTHMLDQLAGLDTAVVVAPHEVAAAFRDLNIPLVTYTDTPEVEAIVAALEAHFPAAAARQSLDRWSRLYKHLLAHGFVADAELPAMLECATLDDAVRTLRNWRTHEVQYVPGLGLCTHQRLQEIGALLQRKAA